MMLRVAIKSPISSYAVRVGASRRPRRATFFSASTTGKNDKVALRRILVPSLHHTIKNNYDTTSISASAIAGGGPGRVALGNPSTMAFLGIRNKSSGAAFCHQIEEDDDALSLYDAAKTSGSGIGRSHQEAWMVNLGRGDNEWLDGPRGSAWFTGLEPRVCPGVDDKGILRSLPLPNLSAATRQMPRITLTIHGHYLKCYLLG